MLKILEEWLMNYKSKLGDQQDDKDEDDEGDNYQLMGSGKKKEEEK
eukprot:CAMPEP_0170551064 /NCGR_PEP_ID=MMETSP0211-20121228/9080_1 /TAXON_ID=311385 /ORGANISM="Pseudokeronopsis sp., Strain OXSARD2" /LENGTH=45 /DNA_ID= /DNA_START= /DNA_END= /DNA_ORIENTATION=